MLSCGLDELLGYIRYLTQEALAQLGFVALSRAHLVFGERKSKHM